MFGYLSFGTIGQMARVPLLDGLPPIDPPPDPDPTPTIDFASIDDFIDYMGSDLVAIWDASDETSLIRSNGISTSWVDKISNITLAANGSPVYSATGLGGVSPAVVLNGTTQSLSSTVGDLSVVIPAAQNECWIFALIDNDQSDSNTRTIMSYGGTTDKSYRAIQCSTVSSSKRFNVTTGSGPSHTDTVKSLTGVHIVGGKFSDGGAVLAGRVDGVETTPASTTSTSWTTADTNSLIVIGNDTSLTPSSHWHGSISIVVILTGDITTDKLEMVEGIMNSRAEGRI